MNVNRSKHFFAVAVTALTVALALPTLAFGRLPQEDRALLAGSRTVATTAPALGAAQPDAPTATATDPSSLAADLAFMREEEKLARDVYTALAQKWGLRTFSNIARSEQVHMDAVLVLLDRYGFTDPAANLPAGSYADPHLQELYDSLIARGSVSVDEALAVGKLIEQTDIADLDERIARTDEADVVAVYKNLRAGSVNHLAAFEKQLSGQIGPSSANANRGFRGGR